MDVQTAMIGVAAFVGSAAVLTLISMFGIKEKSYEEALAEQRMQNSALLGHHNRPKSKEKKTKKAGKKMKEKQNSAVHTENETAEESEATEHSSSAPVQTVPPQPHHKLHVEFKEPATGDNSTALPSNKKDENGSKHDSNKERQKPKSCSSDQVFHDFEVDKERSKLKITVEQEINERTKSKPCHVPDLDKISKDRQGTVGNENSKGRKNANKHQTQAGAHPGPEKDDYTVEVVTITSQTNGFVTNVAKEKKKKKMELNILQQLAGIKDGDLNLPVLLDVVRKAELTRNEVQILIDLLLNKQHEAPEVLDEWSEGKADPIQKLKRQLADKEKALSEEQEALAGAQSKLREVRAEHISERSQWHQRIRNLEEVFQAKQAELQAANSRAQIQNQSLQQSQNQLKNIMDENSNQRQQMDIGRKKFQEAEATIMQLDSELQELRSRNNQYTMEIHNLNEQNIAKEHQQSILVQLQHQMSMCKNELDQKEEINRQLDEERRELEKHLAIVLRQESDLKVEVSQLKTACQQQIEEVRRLELVATQAIEEVRTAQKQKDDMEKLLSQVQSDLQASEAEKKKLQSASANGVSIENEAHKEELLNLRNELGSVKSQLQQTEKKLKTDLDASESQISRLHKELNEEKNKNNDLRKKNWKVMDALKDAENRILSATKNQNKTQPAFNIDEVLLKVRKDEQDSNRRFLLRMFPNITVADNLPHETWLTSVEDAIKKYVASVQQHDKDDVETMKLLAQIQQYKSVIDDTEGMLKKLQQHIEQEEIHWRKELKAKEAEIETIKKQHISELQVKVTDLERQLTSEMEARKKAYADVELLNKKLSDSDKDKIALKKLSEEADRLSVELSLEKKKNAEFVQIQPEVQGNLIKLQSKVSDLEGQLSLELAARLKIMSELEGVRKQAVAHEKDSITIKKLTEEAEALSQKLKVEQLKVAEYLQIRPEIEGNLVKLQGKIKDLEVELHAEQGLRQKTVSELESLKIRLITHEKDAAIINKLTKEAALLNSELIAEKQRNLNFMKLQPEIQDNLGRLQSRVTILEGELASELDIKKKVNIELENLRTQLIAREKDAEAIKKLSEEAEKLSELLKIEKRRNADFVQIQPEVQENLIKLQASVADLESKLNAERDSRQKLKLEFDTLNSRTVIRTEQDAATIKKLTEDVDRLNKLLQAEQKKNAELTKPATTNVVKPPTTNNVPTTTPGAPVPT